MRSSTPVVRIAASLVLLALGVGVGVAIGRRTGDDDGGIPPRHRSAAIAERFAPVLRFAAGEPPFAGERFFPLDRTHYVQVADLRRIDFRGRFRRHHVRPHHEEAVTTSPDVASLPSQPPVCRADFHDGCHYYLALRGARISDGPDAFRRIQARLLGQGAVFTVYWHFRPYDPAGAAIQYWFFYVFNDFGDWHEADFEQITIELARRGTPERPRYVPVEVGYSVHDRGLLRRWNALAPGTGRLGDHPVVYVARGSHANYFTTRSSSVRDCPKVIRRIFCVDRPNGRGRALVPGDYALTQLSAPTYVGDYGSGSWVKGGKIRLEELAVSDPRTRPEWRDPLRWLRRLASRASAG